MEVFGLRCQLRERLALLLDEDPQTIQDASSFEDLGVDSMMRLELISMIEQQIGFELPEQDTYQLKTIDLIDQYVTQLEAP